LGVTKLTNFTYEYCSIKPYIITYIIIAYNSYYYEGGVKNFFAPRIN